MKGIPVEYSFAGDDLVAVLLIVAVVMMVMALTGSSGFFIERLTNFIHHPSHEGEKTTQTATEVASQAALGVATAILAALLFYFFAVDRLWDEAWQMRLLLVGVYFSLTILYFGLKAWLYTLVNGVLFGIKASHAWMRFTTLMHALLCLPLLPLAVGMAYNDILSDFSAYYLLFFGILLELLTYYKSLVIFFRQKCGYLRNILYLCTLEIVPTLIYIGVSLYLTGLLKTNFIAVR